MHKNIRKPTYTSKGFDIKAEGWNAFFDDVPLEANPYDPKYETTHVQWKQGWRSGWDDARATWDREYFNNKFGIEESEVEPIEIPDNEPSLETVKSSASYNGIWSLINWSFILSFGVGGLYFAFSTLASIIHFQIFGAIGYFFLMVICVGVTGFFKGIVDDM